MICVLRLVTGSKMKAPECRQISSSPGARSNCAIDRPAGFFRSNYGDRSREKVTGGISLAELKRADKYAAWIALIRTTTSAVAGSRQGVHR